ncbi:MULTISPECIES: transglutaminase-like domain-containing protein [unclassified Rhodococcus (in: high G+C Gram-positive bacteria)]|uniref:transglutaminase-like domain-containing protein n=1 Tax=unclassified Rhodococcus (in: high G+C Gram-positive bacteria) TaxID=192944 RepID=UPI001C9BB9FF|nr:MULTISPECIES: transglutaminase-like domain-containing protein [unclassified Rhodococcus (in: high G+C Gram-positive bacteria)]MBY6709103.1 transglutaminase domain-containing protein [Rhodococcus sp. BP-241]
MNEASTSYLGATKFLDIDHESVQAFAAAAVGEARTDRDKVKRLFAAVRDQIWYDPYAISDDPAHYRASFVLETGRAYCVPKAVLLTAVCRAVGIPALVGFADVRNHLQTDALRTSTGTDLFVYHGYSRLYIEGRWLKATPAFNSELCDRFGVPAMEFDGRHDALLHPFTADGARHMEYVRERGVFDDLPLSAVLTVLRHTYGPLIFTCARGVSDSAADPGGGPQPDVPAPSVTSDEPCRRPPSASTDVDPKRN